MNRTANGTANGTQVPALLAPSPENGDKRTVRSEVVKVLRHRRTDRGMRLEEFASRCVREGELHELVTTDHLETEAGSRIDRVGFLGFVEISVSGVLDRGDIVLVDGEPIGTLLGFDACHFPNHYNVLIHTAWTLTGPEAGLRPGSQISFRPPPTDGDPGTGRP
ncbi:DUF6917 domain-containing protein [Streptomyces niveus]|uniref:DUF6917 domain-containing protein n=1 Tax=Streptomyces niveus TaxID=193462 RepID=UPI001F35D82C|nr:hypothetical protein [Streptomyces niveus]